MDRPITKHPYKLMEYEGQKVEIDELLVPLMEICWHYGIRTNESCQGDEEVPEVFLSFPAVTDMLTFVAACMYGEPSDLVERIEMKWRVECLPIEIHNLALYEQNGGKPNGKRRGGPFIFCVVFFPQDLPETIERLREGCAEVARLGWGPYADPAVAAGFARMVGRPALSRPRRGS